MVSNWTQCWSNKILREINEASLSYFEWMDIE